MRRISRISYPAQDAPIPAPETLMTTLTSAPLAPLLDRLFADAAVAREEIGPAFADLSDDEQLRLMRSKTDYRDLYGRLRNVPLPVSRDTGRLLYMLARSSG